MRLIDADELIEHVWRDRVDSRERIANLVESMPTVRETNGVWLAGKFTEDDLQRGLAREQADIDYFMRQACGAGSARGELNEPAAAACGS